MSDYLIVYNHNQQNFNSSDIHRVITNLDGNSDWWHYLPNVYIVSSAKTEQFIADKIISEFPGLLFLVVQVNLNNHNGVLPKDAWEWIKKKTRVMFKLKAATPPRSLSQLLSSQPPVPQNMDPLLDLILGRKIKQGY